MKKLKNNNQKLRKLKKELIYNREWKNYVKHFRHRQMRLLVSKIALIYNFEIPLADLVKLEKLTIEAAKNKNLEMFVPIFIYLEILIKHKANWADFGRFIFYVFQTSTFYKDMRHKQKNIFTKQNIIEQNYQKRKYFYSWLHSLPIDDLEYNLKIIKVQKVVF